jgi:hypothetical protein
MLHRLRDLVTWTLGNDQHLVVVCDAEGGVGPKPGDVLQVAGEVVGEMTVRVVLAELLEVGAEPFLLVNNLCVDPETSRQILRGIEKALAGFSQVSITGSMEKNFPTVQTALGITALGIAKGIELQRRPLPGDLVAVMGFPYVGEEVMTNYTKLPSLAQLKELRNARGISLVVPCGSGGIANELVHFPGLELTGDIPLHKSAGPARRCRKSTAY